ncbi:MAG: hypothetical protein JRD68_07555 [Deltaproteobacteria bacterium]|nr:hypothetical protein [Deltaproteobacteria bacterium]
MSAGMDQRFVAEMRKKLAKELVEKEREGLAYWQEEVLKIIKRRHQDLAGFQNDVQKLYERMETRLKTLETGRYSGMK